jgi:GNAT superfamily N-acetyltransferase
MIRLERVIDALPAGFAALQDEARVEGFGMLDVLVAEWAAQKTRFDRDGEALLAGYMDSVFAGIGGLTLDPHSTSALRMRRFYVRPDFRRCGVGRAIADALLARCEGRIVTVNAAPGSASFYESLGFVPDPAARRTHVLRQSRR